MFDTNKCIGCQTCTMACKTCWTSGSGQEYMLWNNVETKPWGLYPLAWDVRELELLGPQNWDATPTPARRSSKRRPLARRTSAGPRPAWTTPTRTEVRTRSTCRSPSSGTTSSCRTTCGSSTCPGCATTARIRRACRRVRASRSTSGPRTASCSSTKSGAAVYRVCFEACPYKKIFYNHTTRVSEKCVFCFPAVEEGYQPRSLHAQLHRQDPLVRLPQHT